MNQEAQTIPTNIQRTAELVSAYVSNNSVPASDLPNLISTIHASLGSIGSGMTAAAPAAVDKPTASQIRKSISHTALISFEDGKSYKTLKRHLTTRGLTPEAYRTKYGLPHDYPMVAPSYSEQRSSLAKSLGLGRPGSTAARQKMRDPQPAQATASAQEMPKRRPGRKKAEQPQRAAA